MASSVTCDWGRVAELVVGMVEARDRQRTQRRGARLWRSVSWTRRLVKRMTQR